MVITVLERTADDLKKLNSLRQAVKGIQVRMRMLETDAVGIGGFDFERPRVNDKNRKKSGRFGAVDEREKLQQQERALQGWIEHMEQALAQMHPDDQTILQTFFCKNLHSSEAVYRLEKELNITRSAIYKQRERALFDLAARLGYIV